MRRFNEDDFRPRRRGVRGIRALRDLSEAASKKIDRLHLGWPTTTVFCLMGPPLVYLCAKLGVAAQEHPIQAFYSLVCGMFTCSLVDAWMYSPPEERSDSDETESWR